MFNHEPAGYRCPFCFLLDGGDTEFDDQRDIVLRTGRATALVAAGWRPGNEGHVLVIPNAHHHVHVFPRYDGDDFYGSTPRYAVASLAQRLPYAEKLRGYLGR